MPLKGFRYLRDPVFLVSLGLFLANKLVLKPHTGNVFVHGYLNDLLCIPLWVPVMLTGMRLCRFRNHDRFPSSLEILIPLIFWSAVFEVWLPRTRAFGIVTTADPLDVLAYAVGAAMASVSWRLLARNGTSAVQDDPPDRAE